MKKILLLLVCSLLVVHSNFSQKKSKKKKSEKVAQVAKPVFQAERFGAMKWRNIGPFRGGRSVASSGVPGDPMTYYFGSVGGGIWKTVDAGISWKNISDGFFKSGSVGAIAVAPNDANVIYVGMGEHAARGVMTSHGDGMYKSTDAGATWTHIGLEKSMTIAEIRVHPQNPDMVWVAVQGALWGKSKDRGVYKSTDGGATWRQVLFINENTGAADLSLDVSNPRILYAGMWDHQRTPWKVRSGGPGSGIWKSTDGGENWKQLEGGLPKKMGKVAVDVSPANPMVVYANIEAEKGGVFRSNNSGKTWTQTNSQRVTVARAWYYIEIFADPNDENKVYVLNAPVLKSIDGGRTFSRIRNPHGDQHHLWINPDNSENIILSNDGGGCITFNGGKTWSSENNQPTAQFYRVITDNQFPYYIYGGQQDNSTVAISSQTRGGGIGVRDWHPVAGGESAFIAFDPDNPTMVYGTSIQGMMDSYNQKTGTYKDIMVYPQLNLGTLPKDMKYRFNWNGPLTFQPQNPRVMYCGGNILMRTEDAGMSWKEISKDLTRNETSKHGEGGVPFTNEAAGGEVYNTISYIATSPHQAGVVWVGTDDGLVHVTQDDGKTWFNATPEGLPESLINAIEISPNDPATAYLAVTRHKFNDLSPMIFATHDFGKNWKKIVSGLPTNNYVRVVREDPKQKEILYAGTEGGLFVSFDRGAAWHPFQNNLPICPITDLTIRDNDLVAATSGRAFWILDDLSALQQTMGLPDTAMVKLVEPAPTVKFTLSGGGSSSASVGQNPLGGVTLDYYLPHDWTDSSELKLEVLNENGKVIRTMTNQKPKDFKRWEGGPPPPKTLPAQAGLNRTNWDMRHDMLPAVEGVFVMGDYRGHLVAPGKYTLRLSSEEKVSEVSCEVVADPRVEAAAKEYATQQAMLTQIESAVWDIHESVNRLRSVKKQLAARMNILKEIENVDDLLEKGKTAEEAIKKWEENLIQPKQETFQDVINFRNQLNTEFLMLKSAIDSHEPQPTAGTQQRLEDLKKDWSAMKTEMNRVITEEVGGFNEMYAEKNLPVLILPKSKIIKP